jgi:hypothetical protein
MFQDTAEKIQKINKFFTEAKYTIEINGLGLIKISNKNIKTECIEFYITSYYILIQSVKRCGDITGTVLLENIFKLAQELLNIEYIELIDESGILICEEIISLRTIKILTTGQSWYNKLGYKSTNYIKELEFNSKIIKQKYKSFIESIPSAIPLFVNKIYNEYSGAQQWTLLEKLTMVKKLIEEDKILEEVNTLFPVRDDNVTVQEYFSSIWEQIQIQIRDIESKKCEDPIFIKKCKLLSNFINIIEIIGILEYDTHLKKFIKPEITDVGQKLDSKTAMKNKYIKYKNKYLNLKNQLGVK